MFTKQHYNIIAAVIADTHTFTDSEDELVYDLVERLTAELEKDNPNFDAPKFKEACGVWEYDGS